MPRFIALEWDSSEARVVLARGRGTELLIEQAFAVGISGDSPAEQIRAALAERDIGRVDALVSVGRASIELRQLQLPHAPLNELPDLVRFQAMRQFANIGEDWTLDFMHVDTGDDETFNVLAAAISPDLVHSIRETCEAAGLDPKSFVLRPFAAASIVRRASGRAGQCRLIIDVLNDEADLTIMVDQFVVFMRTVRLAGGDPESRWPVLVAEIRRTIAAAQNQLGRRKVEQVVLCGLAGNHRPLPEMIHDQLGLDVDLYDPFESVSVSRELDGSMPANRGRFAPLLGMLVDQVSGDGHNIDFLNPRRKIDPPNRRRSAVWIGAIVAAVVLLAVAFVGLELARLDADIEQRAARSQQMDAQVKRSVELDRDVKDIRSFLAGDVTWLDELYDLSEKMPPAEASIVTQLTANTATTGGGLIVEGYVADPAEIEPLENRLRTPARSVVGTGAQEDLKREGLRWRFKESISIRTDDDSIDSANQEPVR